MSWCFYITIKTLSTRYYWRFSVIFLNNSHLIKTFNSFSFTVSINKLYCFNYQPAKDDFPKNAGWDYFKLENEFKRMRVPNDTWTLCNLNANYDLCDTYPRQIYVPQEANTAMLIGSSRFRSKGRLPALTYLHSNKVSWNCIFCSIIVEFAFGYVDTQRSVFAEES